MNQLDRSEIRFLAPDEPGFVPAPRPPVSWSDFWIWLHQDVRAEWVDGTIHQRYSESADHQMLAGHVSALLWMHRDAHDRGGRVFSRFLMRLASRPSCREPDITFVHSRHVERVAEYWIDGPADLVVEIVSLESIERDHHEKLAEYEAAGIPEYWIIDPLQSAAFFYQLGEDGRYQLARVGDDGIYTSREVTGFRLRVSWLWQRPLPTIHEALADLPDAYRFLTVSPEPRT